MFARFIFGILLFNVKIMYIFFDMRDKLCILEKEIMEIKLHSQ